MSKTCPKCGADRTQKTSLHVKYACGSCDLLERRDLDLSASFLEGVDCKDRQIAALTARVEELEMGVARENQLLKAAVKDYNRVCAKLAAVMEWRHGNHKKFSTLDRILAAKEGE